MNYNFKLLYKKMFFEHYKISIAIICILFGFSNFALISSGVGYLTSAIICTAIVVAMILFKGISTLIRAGLLIYLSKKGHRQSKIIYRDWIE